MVAELRNKSIHDLRVIAQSFGVTDIFEKDAIHLAQEIELKQQRLIPPPPVIIPKPEYDARLMTKPPARRSTTIAATELLAPYIQRGLKLSFTEETWSMAFGTKNDCGSLRMPLRNMIICAQKVMQ